MLQEVAARGAGIRGARFHCVKAVHTASRIRIAPAAREVARIAQAPRAGAKEIRIEGQDYLGAVQAIYGVEVFAEGLLGALSCGVAAYGFVLMPAGLRKLREQGLYLCAKGWRADGFSQNAHSGTALGPLFLERH